MGQRDNLDIMGKKNLLALPRIELRAVIYYHDSRHSILNYNRINRRKRENGKKEITWRSLKKYLWPYFDYKFFSASASELVSKCNMFHFGCFRGVWVIIADVSDNLSVPSSKAGLWSQRQLILHRPAFEDGTDRVFRNVGYYHSDAGETPKMKHITFNARRKLKI
jgi:hypothetical protein